MEPQIIEKEPMWLAGMDYFGPIGGEGWSKENQIAQLWERFAGFGKANRPWIASHVVNPAVSFEVTIWNEEEFEATKKFYVFAGLEVNQPVELPLQLVAKALPSGLYAYFTVRGEGISCWETSFFDEWLPESGFQLVSHQGYHYQIQSYEEGRFKGLGDLLAESELEVYVALEDKT